MENYNTELINLMKSHIGKRVKLNDVHGVEWVGYKKDTYAFIVGVDDDSFFEVSYDSNEKYGWKADMNEVELIEK